MTSTFPIPDDLDPRRLAKHLYFQGWRVVRIAETLKQKPATIHSWKRRDQWDDTTPLERVDCALETRMIQLISMPTKGNSEYKELDALGRQMERLERVRRYRSGGNEADLNPKVASRNAKPRKAPEKNAISEEQQAKLVAAFLDKMFGYQKHWHRAGQTERIRNILKSRQIGATYYFAHEAFIDALQTGRNQIFLSASKAQAHLFRAYIVDFARDAADVELKGEVIKLPNGAELAFLGTNGRTAQGRSGNVYVDEVFWIPRYQELRKLVSAMASQKRFRMTYFSTPSAMSHEAYPFWTGEHYNKGRPKKDHIKLDVSHAALAGGLLCADGQWRQIVTIEDALRGGCDLFDLDRLRLEYSPEELLQLFYCQFIDDGASVFSFASLQRCMVDSWELWSDDFKPFALRPYGHRDVWLGYDPSESGDSAALVIVAPPLTPGGKFRVLERMQFKGWDFAAQAKAIKDQCERYNVAYLGIDSTGLGSGVFQLVKQFRPDAVGLQYSLELKTKMVLKAMDVIHHGRLEFEASHTDIAASFLSIKKTSTASGRAVTFQAGRSEETSHADLAFAVMHTLINEPLEGASGVSSSFMEFS
ncbi:MULTISPECIES: terminase ATPase subunit family protein [Chromobacterium]|uniref:terminase ATPase subunit family protein n=1 Tax=Chromobacterium TaxID=535 RepID=UPI00188943B5|nr:MULTISPECIES: terminase ATPase subunit family protein [Chromobacterium]QOZ83206.1 oxidoreductase [Chromobacterium sp. Rain0013]WON83307.1 terminase ATPase subunit family protein [Chromobacterium haemolyticum]